MNRKKYLLVPGNNALSHVAKCLALSEALIERGHEARIAVSRKHSAFLTRLSIEHFVLPDIQENDDSGFPSVEWFRDPRRIAACIHAEVSLLREYRPDRVLGVFRFTLKASAAIAGVPVDSLICGCMTPVSEDVLGFAEDEPGRDMQRIILDGFFRYAGSKLGASITAFGLPKSNGDIRNSLLGERTFLWDFPEFAPLRQRKDLLHVGPISWNRWPADPVDIDLLLAGGQPLAVVAFGTCTVSFTPVLRIVQLLLDRGYTVLLAGGGQKEFLGCVPADPRVVSMTFAPLAAILPHASLVVTHGGQLTVFESLQNRIPVIVMPFQPEQAHSGVCLERMGCGLRLIPPQPFQGNPQIYMEALERMSDDEVHVRISSLLVKSGLSGQLLQAQTTLARYGGVTALATALTES
ncbi:MAG TPA: glycosyltransferase [Nitrospirota bacterium]|nr:glycosyltransferase [Nitrospirota bacterium]